MSVDKVKYINEMQQNNDPAVPEGEILSLSLHLSC